MFNHSVPNEREAVIPEKCYTDLSFSLYEEIMLCHNLYQAILIMIRIFYTAQIPRDFIYWRSQSLGKRYRPPPPQ